MAKETLLGYLEEYASTESPVEKNAVLNRLRDKYLRNVRIVHYVWTITHTVLVEGQPKDITTVVNGALALNISHQLENQIALHILLMCKVVKFHEDLNTKITLL